jgi:hypothetical protein
MVMLAVSVPQYYCFYCDYYYYYYSLALTVEGVVFPF